MGILGKLFDKDKVIEGAFKGIDKSILSKEETLDYHLMFIKAYTPFKILQRIIYISVAVPYILVFFLCVGLYTASLFLDPCMSPVCKASQLAEGSKFLFNLNNETFGYPFLAIVCFYTGGGMGEGWLRARQDKK